MTVIAAGFDGGTPKRRDEGTVLRREPKPQQTQEETRAAVAAAVSQRRTDEAPQATSSPAQPTYSSSAQPSGQQPARPATPPSRPAPRQVEFDDDDLDVPDFLK